MCASKTTTSGSGKRLHQPTLLGLWHGSGSENGGGRSESADAKRHRGHVRSAETSPATAPALRGLSAGWKNVSLPRGPMLLLRGRVGGKRAAERKLTRDALASLPDWNDDVTFTAWGRECRMRRRICQFSAGGGLSYSYSGLKNVKAPEFPPILRDIKCQVEGLICKRVLEMMKDGSATTSKHLHFTPEFLDLVQSIETGEGKEEIYNYCLLNHYRDGEDRMGYHADDEAALDARAPIASVSLGVARNFDVRPRGRDGGDTRARAARIALGDGDLLLMLPPMQRHYEHAVPAERRVAGERINLTFRRIAAGDDGRRTSGPWKTPTRL